MISHLFLSLRKTVWIFSAVPFNFAYLHSEWRRKTQDSSVVVSGVRWNFLINKFTSFTCLSLEAELTVNLLCPKHCKSQSSSKAEKKRILLNWRAINWRIFFPRQPRKWYRMRKKKVRKNRELCDWHEASNYINFHLISLRHYRFKMMLLSSRKEVILYVTLVNWSQLGRCWDFSDFCSWISLTMI
jgi:hypothetical protein